MTSGSLPTGLALSTGGVFSGTPSASGSATFTVTATDSSSGKYTGSQNYTLTINPRPTITLTPSSLAAGQVGAGYSQALTAAGGTAPYSYAVTSGSLPTGLALSTGGVFSGTPSASGSATFTVTATDSSSGKYTGSQSYTLTINPRPTITLTPSSLAAGQVGAGYSQALTAAGGTAPYNYAVTSGSLPTGLALSTGGVFSGTPSASGAATFTVTATDSSSGKYTGSQSYTLTINPATSTITLTPSSLAAGQVGAGYSQALTAAGGTAPYSYAVTSGSLPTGLALSTGGVFSGTPSASGSATFTVTATDSSSGRHTGSQKYTITISPTPTIVSRLYITTSAGINAYNVASTGKLSLVSGSPFKSTTGLAIGMAGNHFVTVGTTYIRSYAMTSTGGIGGQVSQINSSLFYGAECGTTAGGTIDHTGQEVYVQTAGAGWNTTGSGICDAVQTYKVNATTGQLTFNGSDEFDTGRFASQATPFVLAPNNAHAYNLTGIGQACEASINAFYRDGHGSLYDAAFNQNYPTTPGPYLSGGSYEFPLTMGTLIASDATNHLAFAMFQDTYPPCGDFGPVQLASYTVDYYGNLTTTNKGTNMPAPGINPTFLSISPAGNLLAVASNAPSSSYGLTPTGTGLQIFHFNGASPITKYSAVLTTTPIDSIVWDKFNHLFAISKSTKKLYVYTITPTTIVPASGSPYAISSPSTLFVKPL